MKPVQKEIFNLFEDQTGLKLGKLYDNRFYVAVFQLKDDPSKVVKIVDNACPANQLTTDKFLLALKELKSIRGPFVKIHQYDRLGKNHYYYVMDRLKKLSAKMRSHVNQTYLYHSPLSDVPVEFRNFAKSIRRFANKYGYRHDDLHGYNVMTNDKGQLKMIDLESFW